MCCGLHIIREWERRPVFLFGKYAKTAGPGIDWIQPVFHTVLADLAVQDRVEALQVDNVETHDNVRRQVIAALKEAAREYDDAVWKLKGLETLTELMRSANNNTVLIPTELLGALAHLLNALSAAQEADLPG